MPLSIFLLTLFVSFGAGKLLEYRILDIDNPVSINFTATVDVSLNIECIVDHNKNKFDIFFIHLIFYQFKNFHLKLKTLNKIFALCYILVILLYKQDVTKRLDWHTFSDIMDNFENKSWIIFYWFQLYLIVYHFVLFFENTILSLLFFLRCFHGNLYTNVFKEPQRKTLMYAMKFCLKLRALQ